MDNDPQLHAFHELVGRIYTDQRLSVGTREIALAMAWLTSNCSGPDNDPRSDVFWKRLTGVLGVGDYRGPRIGVLLAEDAPRYVPPRQVRANRGSCVGPRTRPYRQRSPQGNSVSTVYLAPDTVPPTPRDARTCGVNATIKVVEHDPQTGWERAHWFCRKHAENANQIRSQLSRTAPPPEPVPNTGGLLPCYFEAEWATIYSSHRPGWRAPYHGIRADDWPTPEWRRIPRPPRLAVIAR
jgi:hypothetical protein